MRTLDIPQAIRLLRAESGLSLSKVSEKMSLRNSEFSAGRQWVWNAENGKRNFQALSRLETLFEILGARLEFVALRDGEHVSVKSGRSGALWEKLMDIEVPAERRALIFDTLETLLDVDIDTLETIAQLTRLRAKAKKSSQ